MEKELQLGDTEVFEDYMIVTRHYYECYEYVLWHYSGRMDRWIDGYSDDKGWIHTMALLIWHQTTVLPGRY